ncbi:predicted protein [Postia placenta Mad-698-R]|nr:predicted protein [Postia placenta Mad-698-R]
MVNVHFPLALCLPSRLALLYKENFPPKPRWSVEEIPDLTGKVAIVTGANTGLGFESARILASHGAKVYATARSQEKGTAAVQKINDELAKLQNSSGEAVLLVLSLDDLQSLKRAVDEFTSKETRLDILLNNAGIMMPPEDTKGPMGIDPQFATNVLGPFVLTRLLLPTLLKTTRDSPDGTVRVVNVSSLAHGWCPSGGIRFDDLSKGSNYLRYAQSKLGDLVYARELARRYTDQGVISAAVSPGNIDTGLWAHQKGSLLSPNTLVAKLKYPVSYGVLTQLYACTSPEVTKEDSGRYFFPWARRGHALRSEADDPALGTKLWDWCEEQMKKAGITA